MGGGLSRADRETAVRYAVLAQALRRRGTQAKIQIAVSALEVLEAARRELGIAHRRLDASVTKVRLQRADVGAHRMTPKAIRNNPEFMNLWRRKPPKIIDPC
jgi:hypothetical protein